MIETLAHRGPDGNGVVVDGACGLAHARLSIIDLAGGAQPMSIDDGAYALTFNGEIFNYLELRAELEGLGRVFTSHSDTEVILHAYAAWGDECVTRFNGQWAFALWDRRRQRLFCSRDRLGVRPLFYAWHQGDFVFASEVKALFAAGVERAVDVRGLHQVVTFWCSIAPRTVFRGVEQLPPGCNLVVDVAGARGKATTSRYWQLDYSVGVGGHDSYADDDAVARALLRSLEDAARIRLRADVPVGAYLSGGLDSSVLASIVARGEAKLETFSVRFDDAELDEGAYQEVVARELGAAHRSLACSNDDICALFPEAVFHMETPVVRTAPAPMMKLAGLVRGSGYKVVLTGEGADEMLGGYDIFKEAKIRRFWAKQPSSSLRPLLLKRLYPYMKNLQAQPEAYLRAFFHVDDDPQGPFFSHLPRWRLTQQLKSLFSDDVRTALRFDDPVADLAPTLPDAYREWDPLAQAQYLEATILLPGYILSSQGDRMAMARSIEGRFPFLDVNVVERAGRMASRHKLRGLDEKHVLKRAAAGLVPSAVLKRKKQPYRAPDAASFFDAGKARQPWVEQALSPAALRSSGFFDGPRVSLLVDKARRGAVLGVKDNMALVFVLSTQLVVDRFLKGVTT